MYCSFWFLVWHLASIFCFDGPRSQTWLSLCWAMRNQPTSRKRPFPDSAHSATVSGNNCLGKGRKVVKNTIKLLSLIWGEEINSNFKLKRQVLKNVGSQSSQPSQSASIYWEAFLLCWIKTHRTQNQKWICSEILEAPYHALQSGWTLSRSSVMLQYCTRCYQIAVSGTEKPWRAFCSPSSQAWASHPSLQMWDFLIDVLSNDPKYGHDNPNDTLEWKN